MIRKPKNAIPFVVYTLALFFATETIALSVTTAGLFSTATNGLNKMSSLFAPMAAPKVTIPAGPAPLPVTDCKENLFKQKNYQQKLESQEKKDFLYTYLTVVKNSPAKSADNKLIISLQDLLYFSCDKDEYLSCDDDQDAPAFDDGDDVVDGAEYIDYDDNMYS